MELINYVSRCTHKEGFNTFKTLHAADNFQTFCGKELNEMWYVHSSANLSAEDITCTTCQRLLNETLFR